MNYRVIQKNEPEYKNFQAVAAMLEALSPNGATYEVKDVYLDMGQDWMWTTIVRHGFRECQVLSPRDWAGIWCCSTADGLAFVVNQIRRDKYFADKRKEED